MSWVFGTLAAALGIVFFWGLVAPRNQWRVLAGWSVTRPYADEPSGAAYAVRRTLSAVGLVGVLAVVAVGSSNLLGRLPGEVAPPTVLEQMWGSPPPQLVDRVVTPVTAAPVGLVEFPVLGYQDLDGDLGVPDYLYDLRPFSLLGDTDIAGYIGSETDDGSSAVGVSDLVVNVRGPVLCVPRDALVVETETTVQVAVFYGLPVAPDGTAPDSVAGCPADAAVTGSVLVPLVLSAPLGDRELQALDGTPIEFVPIVE